ncbi:GNAT family N-acetyltransferase [Gottfriedia luciferensis]|uniref:GNAT family N-acetyltransferase n=1 Tax=Gottfriedia luciferensis TaxID=178774 RepID=UPI001F3463B3|nr:GNAT family N-acetyltransferase [Gottfriedia luciferensis]
MIIEKSEKKHFIENDEGKIIAEITFVQAGTSKVIIDHTFVDESLRGQKIASKLVASVVEEMREQDKKIIPLCPFAKAEFERKKEYQDMLA